MGGGRGRRAGADRGPAAARDPGHHLAPERRYAGHDPPGPRRPLKGRLWAYLDPIGRQVAFDAAATHAREGPAAVLAPFTGWLQADAYAGYDALYRAGRIVEVGCWAHARRRFVEALDTDPSAALIVALIQRLYQVRREAA